MSTLLLGKNGKASSGKRMHHINIQYFFVTDPVAKKYWSRNNLLPIRWHSSKSTDQATTGKPIQEIHRYHPEPAMWCIKTTNKCSETDTHECVEKGIQDEDDNGLKAMRMKNLRVRWKWPFSNVVICEYRQTQLTIHGSHWKGSHREWWWYSPMIEL